jgi:hypothetical protein
MEEVGAVELLQRAGVKARVGVLAGRRARACPDCHAVESHDDLLVVVAWSNVQQ